MPDVVWDEKHGLWIRPDLHDERDVPEPFSSYWKLGVGPGDIVLDVGAHIGSAALFFLRTGAAHVVCVEPDPRNVALLEKNLEDRRADVTLIEAAVTAEGMTTTLYLHPGRPSCNSVENGRGREPLGVVAVRLADLIREYGPTRLKVDIEGGEYDAMRRIHLPESIRSILVEFHLRKPEWRGEAGRLIAQIERDGFAATSPPRFSDTAFPRVGVWFRDPDEAPQSKGAA